MSSRTGSTRTRVTGLLFGALVVALLVVSACRPTVAWWRSTTDEVKMPSEQAYTRVAVEAPVPWLPLDGNEDFRVEDLAPDGRVWYERLWHAIEASRGDMLARAESDNVYDYGRWLFQYDAALLMGLRTTGDLRFLDEVDMVAQALRTQLRDGWCDAVDPVVDVNTVYGVVREPDGYRNFRMRRHPDVLHYCRDTGDLNETLTHGHLAMVMYAYHRNRDRVSPSGVDYGERADFWLRYLREEFEAKWRERSRTPWPRMDFISMKFCHTYSQMILYYQYVGLRLLEDGSRDAYPYLRQAMRLTDGWHDVTYVPGRHPGGFIDVDTPVGDAVVYSFGAPSGRNTSDTHLEACPVTYARYMLTSLLALRLDGVDRWDDDTARRLANGLAAYVIGPSPDLDAKYPFAAGVSGGSMVNGMPASRYAERTTIGDWSLTPFAAYSAWDESRRIAQTTAAVYRKTESDEDRPTRVYIPAGMLFAETADPWLP